jgi:hypothetical protein
MKRIVVAALGAAWVVLVPAMALAQEGSDLGKPEGPQVAGTGGSIGGIGGVGGGSAFTGAEVAGLIGLVVALVVVGIAALVLTRRRAASARGA